MPIRYFTLPYKTIVNQIKTLVNLSCGSKESNALALWDTGASVSCIAHELVRTLGLKTIGKTTMLTPSSEHPVTKDVFVVDIELPNKIIINDAPVVDSEIGNQGIGLLIGMSIISTGDFAISNYNNRTIFSFRYPSVEDINFVDEARIKDITKNLKHGKGKRKK